MAKNDSLVLLQNGESRAIKLYDLNEKYKMNINRDILLKTSDELILAQDINENFGYSWSILNNTLYNDLISEMVSGDIYTCPQFARYPYYPNPKDTDEYQKYLVGLKLKDTVLFDKEYWLMLQPEIGGFILEETIFFPSRGYNITNYNGKITMNDDENPYILQLGIVNNPNDYPIGAVGFIYDIEGKPQIIILNKSEHYGAILHGTNDEILTNDIINHHSIAGQFIKSLSFDLRDSENFEYGEEATTGGYSGGSWDNSSDDIGVPTDPNFDFTTQGCGTLYRVFNIKTILNEIFPDYETPSGIDALAEYVHNIFEMQNSRALKDYIVDAYAIPVTPVLGDEENINIGWKTLNYRARPVRKQWVTVSCGRYSLREYYSNFLDYDTQIKLYLPFVGLTDINPEFALGTVEVIYKFDVVSGEFMCYVLSNSAKSQLNSVIAQYNGNAITHFPLNAIDYSSKVNGAINGITNIASGVVEGTKKNVLGAVSDVSTGIMNVATAHPTASMSNSYSGSGALMGIRKPFYLIGRAVGQFSSKYRSEVGLPLNVAYKLSDVHGFTMCQIDDIKIESATEEERNAVCELLRSGIIL